MIPVLHGVWAAAGGLVGDFEHIETQTVGAGGAASITFSSIPGTYKHLQIRGIARTVDDVFISITMTGGSFVGRHTLYGNGTSALGVYDSTNAPFFNTSNSMLSSTFGAFVIDLLDYTSTSKNKTMRSLTGRDLNGSGVVGLLSVLYTSTAAITAVTLTASTGNIAQHSTFSLYGVK